MKYQCNNAAFFLIIQAHFDLSRLNNRPRLRQTLGAEIPIPDPVVASARSEYGMLTRNTKGSDDAVY